jgi:acetyltransferase-like isoleucine patch superfamily enzyme
MNELSSTRPNARLSLVAWLLPPCGLKTWLLRRLGNRIGDGVIIGPNLVIGCGAFDLADGSIISPFNVFRNLASVSLGDKAFIGRLNQFTAAPAYQRFSHRAGVLVMKELSGVTNRHYFDCSGRIEMGVGSGVGGIRTIIQSHEIDIVEDRTTVGTTVIDDHAMTATACLILKNAHIPQYSIVAAGSVVTAKKPGSEMKQGLYAGAPARWRGDLPTCKWWSRTSHMTPAKEVLDL